MDGGGSTTMQANAYGPYAQGGGAADLHTLSALLDGSSGAMAPGDATMGHDAYQQNSMSEGMQDVGVNYGGIDGIVQGGDINKVNTSRTLPMVLANYMRSHNKSIPEEELCAEVDKVYSDLRKPDGTRYVGNLERAVRGSLCSTGMFEKLSDGTWTLREEQTRVYERRLMDRAAKQEAHKTSKRRKRAETARVEEGEGGERTKRKYVKKNPATRLRRGAKREAILDMLGTISENLRNENNWAACHSNPFKGFKGDEQVDDVWKKLGNDKFIFMLQMFNYLTDLIQNRHLIQEQIAKNNSKSKENARRNAANEEKAAGRAESAHPLPESYSGLNSSLGSLEELLSKLSSRVNSVESSVMGNQPVVWNGQRPEV